MNRRVLFSVFGSGGDVLPLVEIASHLRELGHEVRFALPRFLTVLLRTHRFPVHGIGGGREMQFFHDPDVVTTRFDGWASWRTTTERFVAPSLRDDVEVLEGIFRTWRPDVVVAGTFAVAARIASDRCGVPCLDVAIYPQHVPRLLEAGGFAHSLRAAIGAMTGDPARSPRVGAYAWGARRERIMLHDPAVLPRPIASETVVGFPSSGEAPTSEAFERAVSWMSDGTRPLILATLGSFLGLTQQQAWTSVLEAARTLGVRVVLTGPGASRLESHPNFDPQTCRTLGFAPLARLMPMADAVVHHGGIGTMFTQLRSGRAALVLPQGYDQPWNARTIERLNVGLDGSNRPVKHSLEELLSDERYTTCSQQIATRLVTGEQAIERAVAAILALCSGRDGGWKTR